MERDFLLINIILLMHPKDGICSLQNSQSFLVNPLKGSSTLDNGKKVFKLGKSFEKIQIKIKNDMLDQLLQVYSWRSKTQLPIAKVMFYKVIPRNSSDPFTTVQVSYQSFPMTLSDLYTITTHNFLYLLKQSAIGFQKLLGMFGCFLISDKMIGINKHNRCKVWVNQNFGINQPTGVKTFENLGQKGLIDQLIAMLYKKSEKNKMTETLYKQIQNCEKFQELTRVADVFSQKYQIQIGVSYKIDVELQIAYNPSKQPTKKLNKIQDNSFISVQNKRVPKFLNRSQINQGNKSSLNESNISQLQLSKISQLNKSNISKLKQKSRSITKGNNRNLTPSRQTNSHIGFYNPLKAMIRTPGGQVQKKYNFKNTHNDYTLQTKNVWPSQVQTKNNKFLASSINTLTKHDVQGNFQTRLVINSMKDIIQKNQVIKSDSCTSHTNNSTITTKFNDTLIKKVSLFDEEDRNMLQSIVVSQKYEICRKSLYSTFDLQKLGKLGKNVGQSFMPQDFNK